MSAFDAWCAHHRLTGRLRHGSSEAVYRAMWHALAAWCLAQQPALRLRDLQGNALAAYLASRTGLLAADGVLTPRYQQRLMGLVRRVQLHQAWARAQAESGPAGTSAAALRVSAGPPPDTAALPINPAGAPETLGHLLPDQARQLQQLLAAPPEPGARWQTARDRCAAALQLGAGLGPGDVRALRLADVLPVGRPAAPPGPPSLAHAATQLRVAANGSAPAHVVPLADWAGAVLARWLALRSAQALGGPWLFPSTRSGKPWGKVAQYESGRRVLADAGLNPDGGGSFRLRHSFALRQLQHGHDAALVARWLAVVDPQVMLRYQQALTPTAADGSTAVGLPAAAASWPV